MTRDQLLEVQMVIVYPFADPRIQLKNHYIKGFFFVQPLA